MGRGVEKREWGQEGVLIPFPGASVMIAIDHERPSLEMKELVWPAPTVQCSHIVIIILVPEQILNAAAMSLHLHTV